MNLAAARTAWTFTLVGGWVGTILGALTSSRAAVWYVTPGGTAGGMCQCESAANQVVQVMLTGMFTGLGTGSVTALVLGILFVRWRARKTAAPAAAPAAPPPPAPPPAAG